MALIATKLSMPVLRRDLVSRPRLIDFLAGGLLQPDAAGGFSRKLTLVSAPAGFGKTTLVRAWLAQVTDDAASQVAWLSLDPGDNDVVRFWTYVVAALRSGIARATPAAAPAPAFGTSALALLQPGELAQPPSSDRTEAALAALVNDLGSLDGRLLLVLDDAHLVALPEIARGIAFLLDNAPPQFHLVLVTRADPPLPLSRLRARNQLRELRAADLAFSPAEAADFFDQTMALELPEQLAATLHRTTEGWVTGLQMAALALRSPGGQSRTDDARAAELAQSRRYILDYLADEVLAQQPDPLRDFLLRISILEHLSAPLCDALIDTPGTAAETLRTLERANLFIAPLDAGPDWYRLHPLFAELLRRRLVQEQPDLVPDLHRRAAAWYERSGLAEPAIDHALAAGDVTRGADLIEADALSRLTRSENATVLRWIEALPDDVVRARPRLCTVHAWLLLVHARAPEAIGARLEQATAAASSREERGSVAALRALLAVYRGTVDVAIADATDALAALPATATFFRSVAADALGMAHTSAGNLDAAAGAFETVIATAQRSGNTMLAVAALSNLAGLYVLRGELTHAVAAYRQALVWATDDRGFRLPIAARALLGLGELARERNELSEAETYLQDACDLADRYGGMGKLVCLLTLARVDLARGDTARAEMLLTEAGELATASRVTQLDERLVAVSRLHLALSQGAVDRALAWSAAQAPTTLSALRQTHTRLAGAGALDRDYNLLEAEAVALARVSVAAGDADRALALLHPLAEIAAQLGRLRRSVEIHALGAMAHAGAGRTGAALAELRQALAAAGTEPFIRTFVDEGPPMAALLRKLEGIPIAHLLRHFPAASPMESADRTEVTEVADTSLLSPREHEVLALIADGLTNREIGARLYIALDTVKGHTREIYGKLDVHSRTQAVSRARELGLLPG